IPKDLRKAYCKAPGWCDLLISPTSTLGDVNEDGNVDASDTTALINKILGLLNLDDTACDINGDGTACDINGDGTVDVSDVTSLITLILNQ
ncbi:MAG: dockerin type I domain-containing protein, partial [Bacteroidales bacterium]|nr:dockerin type I domain-containing protein [Bacteroidales bacterium]